MVKALCKYGNQIEMPFCVGKIWYNHWGAEQDWKEFTVDTCLAYTVWKMNTLQGIQTLNSCCRHGKKLDDDEGEILIDSHSVYNAIKYGYDVRINHRWWDRDDGAEYECETYEVRIKNS